MAGTFGALVQDPDGKLYILSNNHVLANENDLPIGSPIFQPGLLDGGNPSADRIAALTRFIQLVGNQSNSVDAAIAAIDESVPAPVLSAALYQRFGSRGEADFADKLLSALRYGFGGHEEKSDAPKGGTR